MSLPTFTAEKIFLNPGNELIWRGCTWHDYEEILTQRQDKAGLRIQYKAETQELKILSPSLQQAHIIGLIADLVKIMLNHQNQEWEAFAPVTLTVSKVQGIEPDACLYVQNWQRILGKKEFDLAHDPPPDLAIEVDVTSSTSPEDYAAIAVPELWIYRWNQLLIYEFDGTQYQEVQVSPQFPTIAVKTLIPQYYDRGWQVGSSIAIREFENFLNQV